MLKRIIVFVCIIVLCVSMAIPAFAVGSAGSSPSVWSLLQFDTLTFIGGIYDGTIVNWPYNEFNGSPSLVYQDDQHGDTIFSAYVNGSSSAVTGEFLAYDALGIELNADYIYFDDSFDMYLRGALEEAVFTGASVGFYVLWIQPNDDGSFYQIRKERVDYSFSDGGKYLGSDVFVGDLIELAYRADFGNELLAGGTVLLADVDIRLYYQSREYNEGLYVAVDCNSLYHDYVSSWVSRHNLATSSGGLGGSILSPVSSFLSFEFAPGYSIDSLLWVFVVVAFVLWFIKIVS